jgi:hypothetical protein
LLLRSHQHETVAPLGVLILDTDDDRQFGVGIAEMGLDVAWVDRCQVGSEIAGLAGQRALAVTAA